MRKSGKKTQVKENILFFSDGFTFMEIILAVAIISALLGVSYPLLNKNIKNISFKSFVNKTNLVLDYAKTSSVLKSKTFEVRFDSEYGEIFLVKKDEQNRIVKKLEIPEKIKLTLGKEKISFYPDGTLENFILIISDNGREAEIVSKGFDGKIMVDFGNEKK